MYSIKYSHMDSKDVPLTCFGTSVPSSGSNIYQLLKPIAGEKLLLVFTRFYGVQQRRC
jgi:hypothetical protein